MPIPIVIGMGAVTVLKYAAMAKAGHSIVKNIKNPSSSKVEMDRVKNENQGNINRYKAAEANTRRKLDNIYKKEEEADNRLKNEFTDIIKSIKNLPEFNYSIFDGYNLPAADITEIQEFKFNYDNIIKGVKIAELMAKLSKIPLLLHNPLIPIAELLFEQKITDVVSNKILSPKIEKAKEKAKETEQNINKAISVFDEINETADIFYNSLCVILNKLNEHIKDMKIIIESSGTDYFDYSKNEKLKTENTCTLAKLIYRYLKTPILISQEGGSAELNNTEIEKLIAVKDSILEKVA